MPLDDTHQHSSDNIMRADSPYTPITPAVILSAEAFLTNDDIKALGASEPIGTPIEVVPSPGPGKWINFMHGIVVIDAVANPYTGIDAGAVLDFELGLTTAVSVQIDSGTIGSIFGGDGEVAAVWLLANFVVSGGITIKPNYGDQSQLEDLPLVFNGNGNNGAGEYGGGTSANSGRVKVWYTVEDLP